ncbi:MAG: chloramphenicol acetyltransferase [Bacteroidia bacterium]
MRFHPAYPATMYRLIDTDTWNRKDTFAFFRSFDDPFFNLCTSLEAGPLYRRCQQEGWSFFLACLYHATAAANEIEALRLRLSDDDVRCYDQVHAGSAIAHADHTFSFCYFRMLPDMATFQAAGRAAIEAQRASRAFDPRNDTLDIIHYSVLPWIAFTSMKHARRFGTQDSIPKIIFGRLHPVGTGYQLPVSVELHHALADGYHAGLYFEALQQRLADGR